MSILSVSHVGITTSPVSKIDVTIFRNRYGRVSASISIIICPRPLVKIAYWLVPCLTSISALSLTSSYVDNLNETICYCRRDLSDVPFRLNWASMGGLVLRRDNGRSS